MLFNLFNKPLPPNPNAKGYFLGLGLNRVDPAAYGGWGGELAACQNDIRDLLRVTTLGARWMLPSVLFDRNATIAVTEIAYRQLANQAQPGDLVIITHSHHGGQFKDLDDDEDDGLDETLVLYDGQVPDDVHKSWLARFAAGVRVVLIVDTCHSQTIARAASPLPNLTMPRPRAKAMPREVAAHAGDLQQGSIRELRAAHPAPRQIAASVITLAACKDSQTAMDGERNGEFTGALLKVVAGKDAVSSYGDLIRRARRYCPNQAPQIMLDGPSKHADAFSKQRPFTL